MATQDYRNKLGEKVPGNTTVIGSNLGWKTGGLVHWAWDLGMKGQDYRKVRDEAGGVGTVVHSRIEAYIHRRPQPSETWFWDLLKDDEEATEKAVHATDTAILAFYEWEDTSKLEITGSEVPLVCECHQYGTTLDHPALVKGRRRIVEIKTSNGIYPDFWIQMSAQGHVWGCVHADDRGVAGVRFTLDGEPLGEKRDTPPYVVTWDTRSIPNGEHTLTAVAWDAADNDGSSVPFRIWVEN